MVFSTRCQSLGSKTKLYVNAVLVSNLTRSVADPALGFGGVKILYRPMLGGCAGVWGGAPAGVQGTESPVGG